jgi:serine phosphatase RsbU (regulator of sigma subunit)
MLFKCAITVAGIDSLRIAFEYAINDSIKLKTANDLAAKYEYQSFDSTIYFANEALKLAEKLNDSNQLMIAHYNIGLGQYGLKQYNSCVENCEKALSISKATEDTVYQGYILYKLSRAYSKMAQYDLTIQNQLDAIQFYEARKSDVGVAVMYNNMSIAYKYLGDHHEAINVLKKAIQFYKEYGDSTLYATPYLNIGDNFLQISSYDSANIYLDSAIYYSRKYKPSEQEFIDYIFYWKGEVNFNQGNFEEALRNFETSQIARAEYYDKNDQIYTLLGIGRSLVKLNRAKDGLPYLKKALTFAKTEQVPKRIMMSHAALANTYYSLDDYKNASFHFKAQLALNDTIFNNEKAMAIMSAKTKFKVDNYAKEIALLEIESEMFTQSQRLKDAELEETRSRQNLLYLILGFSVLSIIALFYVIKRRNKTNKLLKAQKDEIQSKSKEITDSIGYAKRIQNAILPPRRIVKEYLVESFIIYKPKDVVAGDFYWMEQKEGKVLYAAADCTGHGVPGAMVSVICNNALNRSVREYGLTDPGEILNKARAIVIQEFEKSDEEVKDGMDIAICVLEDNGTLKYAGAHNPLWIIRNEELIEIKADKQPIGKFDHPQPYQTHVVQLQLNDSIYIFTDGLVDQFGGEKGKKFKVNAFRNLLLGIQNLDMQQQKSSIENTFEAWKGNEEQVDDICIIGVKYIG